jgi:hypothetical protein
MRLSCAALLVILGVGLSVVPVHAEKSSVLQPLLAKAGKVVVSESFDSKELPKKWVANKGVWQTKDGSVVGWEKKEDMHAAVLTLQQPFRNSIMRFSFKREGATGFNVSFNHAKGHLFRVVVNDDGLTINKDKDKKDPASKPLVLGKAEVALSSGQWHTMQIEIQGDKVAVQIDNGAKLQGSHSGLDVEKTGYRFVTRGATLHLDDLTIWQVGQ